MTTCFTPPCTTPTSTHKPTHSFSRNSDSLLSHRERNWEISQVGSLIPNRSFGGYQWNAEEAANTHADTNQNTKIASIIARFTKGLLELGSRFFSCILPCFFFLGNKKKPQPLSDAISIMSFAKENCQNVLLQMAHYLAWLAVKCQMKVCVCKIYMPAIRGQNKLAHTNMARLVFRVPFNRVNSLKARKTWQL